MGLTDTILPVLSAWSIEGPATSITQLTSGHIHQSYRVDTTTGKVFFLQQINTRVFSHPGTIAETLNLLNRVPFHGKVSALSKYIPTSLGQPYFQDHLGEYWRLLPWIESIDPLDEETEEQKVFRTAEAFGEWTYGVNAAIAPQEITPSLEGFHNLSKVLRRFQTIWNASSGHRKTKASETCARLSEGGHILEVYDQLVDQLPTRIIHGDAKVDNILMDADGHGRSWIIDLDTVMPGYLWMDVGDMIRSMACSTPESSDDLESIHILPERVELILQGYGQGLGELASPQEWESIRSGASCILYEQAIRFLTDYLEGDIYYPTSHEEQNLLRAQNQLLLWENYSAYLAKR